ncbi:MAG: BolA family transcriptional regulator [Myxococcales bacterium]|nr:BolA family transcriptional regulator [Myxococcales bacterium]
MPLQILSELPPEPSELIDELRGKILAELPDAEVEVSAGGPGHFEVTVTSASFEGLSRVKQQQRVYAAIAPLMAGNTPPVHAIDRMVTRTP